MRSLGLALALILSTVALFALASYALWESGKDADRNSKTTTALCALRADLHRRVITSEAFLEDHPTGIPGIPAVAIRANIANQRRTLQALKILDCKEET